MANLRFGTDGVRGRAYDELTTVFASRLGRAAAEVFDATQAVIARDTRASGPDLRDALARGFTDGGLEVLDLGVAPTPAVAHCAGSRGAVGAMVSASHNAWHDNGIKLFTPLGDKLSDREQAAIERLLDDEDAAADSPPVLAATPTTAMTSMEPVVGDWVRSVVDTVDTDLAGLSVVLDAANGAASHVAAPALVDLGASVTVIANQPDGRNINDGCGSTHPELAAAAVAQHGASVGLALDGDADRLLCVDADGQVVDGDHLMAILAIDLHRRGLLADSTVVVTVMTNLGFHRAMADAGIAVHVTPVGDRHILEALSSNGWSFGGEQSGHLIFRDHATTGDGLLSAVQVLDVMARTGRTLSDLAASAMTSFPQVLRNVTVASRVADPAHELAHDIATIEERLGDRGRILIRSSGTEPVIRVMVEASTVEDAGAVCDELCEVVQARFGV